MTVEGATRWATSGLLVVCLVGLLVWFGSLGPAPEAWALPGGDELAASDGELVGEEVELYGRVISSNPVVITGEYDDRQLEFVVVGLTEPVRAGQYLHLYGRPLPDGEIQALGSVVYPEGGTDYTYAVSTIALLWVGGRFFNRWRLDPARLAVERRDRPLSDTLAGAGRF